MISETNLDRAEERDDEVLAGDKTVETLSGETGLAGMGGDLGRNRWRCRDRQVARITTGSGGVNPSSDTEDSDRPTRLVGCPTVERTRMG